MYWFVLQIVEWHWSRPEEPCWPPKQPTAAPTPKMLNRFVTSSCCKGSFNSGHYLTDLFPFTCLKLVGQGRHTLIMTNGISIISLLFPGLWDQTETDFVYLSFSALAVQRMHVNPHQEKDVFNIFPFLLMLGFHFFHCMSSAWRVVCVWFGETLG